MSSIPSQNCLRELNLFLKNVVNAFDLHSNFNALLHYSFGPRRLTEVVDTALRDEVNRNEVESILNSLAEYAVTELRFMFRKISAHEASDMKHRINLAWVVWDVLQKHFPDGDTQLFVKTLFEDISFLYTKGELEEICLPSDVLKFFGKNPDFVTKEIPLLRDASFYQVASSESSCPFTKQFEEGICKIKTESEGYEEFWKNLVDYKFDKDDILSPKNAITMIRTLFKEWDLVGNEQLLLPTLSLIEKLCCNTDSTSRRTVFEEAQHAILAKGTPDFSQSISNFQKRLSRCVNALSSHNSIQSNPTVFESLKTELQFLAILAPKATLQALITHCIQDKTYTPAVIQILRGLQAVCNTHVTHLNKEYPLLIAVVDIVFTQCYDRLKSQEFIDAMVYTITALCRRKKSVVKEQGNEGKQLRIILDDVMEDSILRSSDVIYYFTIPKMCNSKRSSLELKTMLTLLKRIFSLSGSKDTELSYTVIVTSLLSPVSGSVPVPQLFLLLHTFLLQYESKDSEIPSLCFSVLKGLGNKMKDDGVILPSETTVFLLNKITSDAWWFRYAIAEWFSHPMEHPQQELPSGLFWALPEEHREIYKEVKVDFQSHPVGCLLYSLFELGLFDPELAINLLNKGLDILPMDDLLIDQIALALCDCCAKPFFSHRLPMVLPVLERMIEILDPRMPIPYVLDQVNDNIIRALRQLKSIQIFGKAAKIAFTKIYHHDTRFITYYPSVALDCPKNPTVVAEQLLRAYCELAKIQADKQMQLYRSLIRKRDLGNKESQRESQKLEEQLISQLVILFHEAVMFTRFEANNSSLNVLITMLSEYIKEVQNNHRDNSLDKKKIDYKKTEYVYTNANSTKDSSFDGGDEMSSVVLEDSKINYRKYSDPQYKHPSRRNCSGYYSNESKSTSMDASKGDRFSDTSSIRATARQITHNKTRDQVERRLNEYSRTATPPFQNQSEKMKITSKRGRVGGYRPPRY